MRGKRNRNIKIKSFILVKDFCFWTNRNDKKKGRKKKESAQGNTTEPQKKWNPQCYSSRSMLR